MSASASTFQAVQEEKRFKFGENWRNFLARVDERSIQEAEQSLKSLLGCDDLENLSFLDIGCGSGLFSFAARRLGARVCSFDYDTNSVACATMLRERYHISKDDWQIERGSVLDRQYMESLGVFDVVYSWGVLHHTGAMLDAINLAAARVKPGGLFAFALYRRTRLCAAWKHEKRWYAAASPAAQRAVRSLFVAGLRATFAAKGRSFRQHVANYSSRRGMDFETDIHDWMGGYPYESISPAEVEDIMTRRGFAAIRTMTRPYSIGLFGSGCDEFVYRRCAGEG